MAVACGSVTGGLIDQSSSTRVERLPTPRLRARQVRIDQMLSEELARQHFVLANVQRALQDELAHGLARGHQPATLAQAANLVAEACALIGMRVERLRCAGGNSGSHRPTLHLVNRG
jgi:hypothetical protein